MLKLLGMSALTTVLLTAAETPRNVVVVGDIGTVDDVARIAARVAVLCGEGVDPAVRPHAIEVATDVDLGPGQDRFAPFDAMVKLAGEQRLGLLFRIKPNLIGEFPKAVLRNTIPGTEEPFKPATQHCFLAPAYREALRDYYHTIARRYADEPIVQGFGIGVGLQGETQYPTDGTFLGDFSPTALADYTAWMATTCGRTVTGWPTIPDLVGRDTRIAMDADTYLWALWRAERLADVVGEVAAALRQGAPGKPCYVFSYIGLNAAPGYCPGLLEACPYLDTYLGNISADHGFYAVRDQDRSRPVALGGSPKTIACELDLISAYTDPVHMEAYVRYFCLMGGQPRPFLPVWYGPGKTGGWAEEFWTPYSDDLARQMSGIVNRNLYLGDTESVADVAVVLPEISGVGTMANWGPWMSREYKQSHSDIIRHLGRIGANFELVSEAGLTSERLQRYRLVIVIQPALYPDARRALQTFRGHVLAVGWAGIVCAPAPGDLRLTSALDGKTPTWWPTGARAVFRDPVVSAKADPLLGDLAESQFRYPEGTGQVLYLRGMAGRVLMQDDEGQAVAAVVDWGQRRFYHMGLPLAPAGRGMLLTDQVFQGCLARLLRECGCTAYPELGPLRLFETSRYLLAENPNGTTGTVADPGGDFDGILPTDRLHHRPDPTECDPDGRLRLHVPAGKSVIVRLQP